jgi:hypothetical protein
MEIQKLVGSKEREIENLYKQEIKKLQEKKN